jgi:hypothetical protein
MVKSWEETQGILYCLQHKSYFIDTTSQEWDHITHRMVKFHWNGGLLFCKWLDGIKNDPKLGWINT